jgi:hypothetical protein
MGSPFDVIVHTQAPWPPCSEFFPVSDDGLRTDVQLITAETAADVSMPWFGETLADASRTATVFLAQVRTLH